eukprot:m.149377 g.149377  ORF g.149377 m.149377 type:complete len:832 (+) comp14234_c1_seq4:685-3180(+)
MPTYVRGRGRGRGASRGAHAAPPAAAVAIGRDSSSTGSAQSNRTVPHAGPSHELPSPSAFDDAEVDQSMASVNRTVKEYMELSGDQLAPHHEEIIADFSREAGVCCLVCLEDVRPADAIWNCGGCFTPYHMHCIQQWVRDGAALSTLSDDLFPDQKRSWFCPKCRKEHDVKAEFPDTYRCFCRKVTDPLFDPWLTPHSCGEPCGRSLGCEHDCVLLCHPGQCPPCPRTLQAAECFCGATTQTRRCGARRYSCRRPCGRLLGCGVHRCEAVCHDGPCTPCGRTSSQPCRCGRGMQERPCASPGWVCDEVCDRLQSCKHHRCPNVCCPGGCDRCPVADNRSCPCGRVKSTAPCSEEVPLCGATCGKPLPCGHRCPDRCHQGECGPCHQMARKTCRCGGLSKDAPCSSKPLLCARKCGVPKQCGRHACKRKCCDGSNCPPCEEVCNRRLPCGQHKCQAPCHTGKCYPCAIVKTVHCACGAAEKAVPCGREKITAPPRCRQPCKHPPACSHPPKKPHPCHFGPCPPCPEKCGRAHGDCGHLCGARCTGCASSGKVDSCPPCAETVGVSCFGGHLEIRVKCHKRAPFACKSPCGKQLACGRHPCPSQCHPSECVPCGARCDRPRPEGCTHTCPRPCHDDECHPCDILIPVDCHCKKLKLKVACGKWTALGQAGRESEASCKDRCPKHLSCGHRCTLLCHPGECSSPADCKKRVAIKCPCGRRKSEYVCGAAAGAKAPAPQCDAECAAVAAAAAGNPAAAGDSDSGGESDGGGGGETRGEGGIPGRQESGKARRRRRYLEKQEALARKAEGEVAAPVNYPAIVVAVLLALVVAWFLI